MVSDCSELKRRQKGEQKAREKAEKEKQKLAEDAANDKKPVANKPKENEEEISPNVSML